MVITFLNIYNSNYDELLQVQWELLEFWKQSIAADQINFIHSAKVEFKDFSMLDYPNQERAKREVSNACVHKVNKAGITSIWWEWAGKRYYELDELYNDMAVEHRLMELCINVEETT
jgi:hypothetical protein